ncbi:response regulator [Thalassospira mesophila]|uniref:response regulator n=1 Tax=Thalassospira mesophila TaxID=1293891 RepID=UPI001302982B|nr:response regulator [Thalassospira mesophila]
MSDAPSIIFVDDDPNVLSGLRRRVRVKRPNWRLQFCDNGEEVLGLLQSRHSVDVIVSDMRMPIMDGAELFRKVARLYPEIGRILLSGYADGHANLLGTSATHHFLMKPCDDQSIINAIERALILRSYLRDPYLLGVMSCLPGHYLWPTAFRNLQTALYHEGPVSEDTLALYAMDHPECVAFVQHYAEREGLVAENSTNTLHHLFTVLGVESVKALALLFEIYGKGDLATAKDDPELSRALIMAEIAARLGRRENSEFENIDAIRAAAMLAHVGSKLIETVLPNQSMTARHIADKNQCDIISAEIDVMGISHAGLSACMAALWSFTHEIIEDIAFHHRPESAPTGRSATLAIVYAAQHFAREYGRSGRLVHEKYPISERYLASVGIGEKWASWSNIARETLRTHEMR